MYDIITFGSATWDIFLKPKEIKILKSRKNFIVGKGICFNLGSKIDIKQMNFSSGGGGTNVAATFAEQGFKTAFCGAVGKDISGKEILKEMKDLGVSTNLAFEKKEKPTNHSIIISSNGSKEDRTVLAYRGASGIFKKNDILWKKLKAKWFYIAPLPGDFCKASEDIVDFAFKNKIKVAFNPGFTQLNMGQEKLKQIIKKVDVLILNQEEASLLTKISYHKEKEIFKKLDEICPGVVIMTKGSQGVVVSDGENIYRAGIIKTEVVDRTGAGDSFGAGFVSGFIQTKGDIERAIQLGIANSASCLTKWGAKNGLLEKGESFKKVKISKNLICDYN